MTQNKKNQLRKSLSEKTKVTLTLAPKNNYSSEAPIIRVNIAHDV